MNYEFISKALSRYFAFLLMLSGVGILTNIFLLTGNVQASAALGIVEVVMLSPLYFVISLFLVPIEMEKVKE